MVSFSQFLTHPPSDPRSFSFTPYVRPLQRKMDIATNPVLKSFLAGSFSGTCSTILFQVRSIHFQPLPHKINL